MKHTYSNDYRVKDNVKRTTAIVAIVLGFLALYYCLLPALATSTGAETYVYFDNGLSQYDTVEYSVDNGTTWVVMNTYNDVKQTNTGVTNGITRTHTDYLYVSNVMVAEGTSVLFRGTDSGTVYDSVTNYELGEAADEWGYDYKNFKWTSTEQVIYQGTNCYFAPPKLMQYKYGGYAGNESNQTDLSTLRQFVYAYAEKSVKEGADEQDYLEYNFDNNIGYATLTDVSVTNAAADGKTALYENGALLLDGTYGLKLPLKINGLTGSNGFKFSYTVNYDALTDDTATIYFYQNNNNWISFGFADGVTNDTYYLTIRYRNSSANNGNITNLEDAGIYQTYPLHTGIDYNITFFVDKGYVYCSINDTWFGFGTFPAEFGDLNVYVGVTYYGSEVGGNKDWPMQGTIDNLVFSAVSDTTENAIETVTSDVNNIIYNIAKPGYDSNAIIFPHNGENRTFYNAQYTMEGKLSLVNNPNDLGALSQSTGSTTYEGSYLANADGTNDFSTLFPSKSGSEVKTYKATAQLYDYYSDWELAGKKLEEHKTTYEHTVENTIDSADKLQSLSGGSFSEGSSRISYAYQGFLWNNAISDYYSLESGVTPLYFGSNNSFTGNNRYYKSNKDNDTLFSDTEIANRDYATSLESFIKTGMNAIGGGTDGIAYLIPSVREYINNENLTGFNTDEANIPHGHSNSRAVPGLVNMVNGNIQLANSSQKLVYFNEDYLLGANDYNAVFGKIYNDVEFEFVYNEETGCYEYDSTREKYATRVAQKSDGTYYMEYTQSGVRKAYNDNSSQTNFQFYPFNSTDADTFAKENLMFGMKLNVPFTMYIDEEKRNDSIFKFSGDDDVWVYVDDKLIMDIGGTHTAVGGIVDLKNGYALLGSTYKNNVGEAVETPNGPYLVHIAQSGVDGSISAVEKAAFAIVSSNDLGIGIDKSYADEWIEIDAANFFDDKYRGIDGGKIQYKIELRTDTSTGTEYLKVSVKNAVKVETDTDGNITKTTTITNCEGKELVTTVTDSSTQVDTIYAIFELTPVTLDESTEGGDLVEHNLSIYYMERGLNSSNFKLAFNFVENTERTVEKEFADGNENYTSELDFVNVELYRTEPYPATIDYEFPEEYKLIKSVAHTTDGSVREASTFVRSTDTVGVQYTVNNSIDAGIPVNTVSSIVLSMNGMPLNKQVLKQLEQDAGLRIYMNDVLVAVDNIIFYDEGTVENPQHIIIPCNGNSTVVKVEFTPINNSQGGMPTAENDAWNLLEANGWIIDANAYVHNDVESYITGTGYFTETMFSTDYSLADGETKSFVIESSDTASMFMTEIYNWDLGQYFSTLSSKNDSGDYAWWWYDGTADINSITVDTNGVDNPTLTPGHSYNVTVTRNGNTIIVKYYDMNDNKLHLTLTGVWPADAALSNTLNIRFKSHGGTYTITESDAEIIHGTAVDFANERTSDHLLSDGQTLEFWIETSGADGAGTTFITEVYGMVDNEYNYYTTLNNNSINEGEWFNGTWATDGSAKLSATDNTTYNYFNNYVPGNTYRVRVTRSGDTVTFEYFDATTNQVVALRGAKLVSIPTDMYVRFQSMGGTYRVSKSLDNVITGPDANYTGDVTQSYSMGSNDTRVFIVDASEDAVRLMTELSNEGYYFTTFSDSNGWWGGSASGSLTTGTVVDKIVPGNKYRVTVIRNGNYLEVQYYDLTAGEEIAKVYGTANYLPDTMYVYFRSHGGTFVVEEEYYEQVNITGHKIFADSMTESIIAPASGEQPARTFNASDMRFIVLESDRYVSGTANSQYNYYIRAIKKTSDIEFTSTVKGDATRYVYVRQRAWNGIMNTSSYTDSAQGAFGNGVSWNYSIAGSDVADDLELVVLASGESSVTYEDETVFSNVDTIYISEPYDVTLYTDPVYVTGATLNNSNSWKNLWDNIVESATIEGEAKNYRYFIREVNVSTANGKTMDDYQQVYYDIDGNIVQPTYMDYTTTDANGNTVTNEFAFYSIDNEAGYVKVVNIPVIEATLSKVWSEKTPTELVQTIYVDIYNSLGEYVTTATISPNGLSKVSTIVSDLPAYAYTNGAWQEVTYYVKEKDISGLLPTYSSVWERVNLNLSNGQTITVYPLKCKNEEYSVTITNRPVNTDEFVMWIYKMSAADKDIPVNGAIFQLEKYDESTATWVVVEDENAIVSDEEGYVYLGLLDYGSYRLSETYAPLGYAKTDIMVYFDVIVPAEDGSYGEDSSTKKALQLNKIYTDGIEQIQEDSYIWLDDSYILRVDIANEVVPIILPDTGGSGTRNFVLIGILTILTAFTGMQLLKKCSKKPENINYNNKQLRKREFNFSGWRNIMKTNFKKKLIAFIAIACILTMTLAGSVFAATIEIKGTTGEDAVSTVGKSFSVYKIFSVDKIVNAESDTTAYEYTLTEEWDDFFAEKLSTTTSDTTLNNKAIEWVLEYDDSAAEKAELANILYEYAKTHSITPTASVNNAATDPVVIKKSDNSDLDPGYYLVADVTTTEGAAISAVMLDTLDDERADNLVLTLKVDKLTIDKAIIEDATEKDTNTVKIGDTVNYQLTSKVPSMTGYTSYTYTISDTLSAGLTLNDDIVVKIGDKTLTKDTDYTLTKTTNSFTIDFIDFVNRTEAAGTALTVTYSAVVNENADIGETGNDNTVTLTYSNNPTDSNSTATDTDETVSYTTQIKLLKKNKDDKLLSGAIFELYPADENYVVTGSVIDTQTSDASGNVIFTKENGTIVTLEEGYYVIKETQAPDGYNRLGEDILVHITFTPPADLAASNEGDWDFTYKIGTNGTENTSDNETITIDVINEAGTLFPETGGIGTTIFMVVGGALMLGAVALFALKKRDNLK